MFEVIFIHDRYHLFVRRKTGAKRCTLNKEQMIF
jgi:hypothetical protein